MRVACLGGAHLDTKAHLEDEPRLGTSNPAFLKKPSEVLAASELEESQGGMVGSVAIGNAEANGYPCHDKTGRHETRV